MDTHEQSKQMKKTQTKIATYTRVSTAGQTIASQTAEIDRWLMGHNVGTVHTYTDKSTGDHMARPGLQALEAAIFSRQVTTVVIYRLDRLSRSLADGIATLTRWLDAGVRVVSVSQQFDFHGATGKLIAAVLLGVAEMEQETRRERQAAGIAVAKTKGVYRGRQIGATTASPTKARKLHASGLPAGRLSTATYNRHNQPSQPSNGR